MLCLSGFELYSRWVPLICRKTESGVSTHCKSIGPFSFINNLNIILHWINCHFIHCLRLKKRKENNKQFLTVFLQLRMNGYELDSDGETQGVACRRSDSVT